MHCMYHNHGLPGIWCPWLSLPFSHKPISMLHLLTLSSPEASWAHQSRNNSLSCCQPRSTSNFGSPNHLFFVAMLPISLTHRHLGIPMTNFCGQLHYSSSNVQHDFCSLDEFPSSMPIGPFPSFQPLPQSVCYHPQVSIEI